MGLRAFITSILNRPKKPRLQTFAYEYMVYDFDLAPRRFTVKATDEQEADILALAKFTEMFNAGQTVTTACWPVVA